MGLRRRATRRASAARRLITTVAAVTLLLAGHGRVSAVAGLGPLTSPNRGTYCAPSTSVAGLNAFFGAAHGPWAGGDYQRAIRLRDGRVLWLMQDAWINGSIMHNAAWIQSGRCFTLLTSPGSWIYGWATTSRKHWWWLAGGEQLPDGRIGIFAMEMREMGSHFLAHPVPQAMWLVLVSPTSLRPLSGGYAPNRSTALYGFSVTSDRYWTYLYSQCHQQWGYPTWFGFGACGEYVRLARVPLGRLLDKPTYWNGKTWTSDPTKASAIVTRRQTADYVNPAQVIWDGSSFRMVIKTGDWWGRKVMFFRGPTAHGPWTQTAIIPAPLKCSAKTCDSYFASWVPWRDASGRMMWGLSHNRWDGHWTSYYRPAFYLGY